MCDGMEDFRNLNWSWYTIRDSKECLQYFDTTFCENEKDIFYCHLNEIEPDFLSDIDKDSDNESDLTPIDPRTRKKVENIVIDNTAAINNDEKPLIFQNFPRKSSMTKTEHQSCLTALKSLMEKKQVSVNDLLPRKRIREMQSYNEFVMNYTSDNPNPNHKLKKMLIEQYKQLLEAKTKHILSQPDEFYSLQTAVPFDEKRQAPFNLRLSNAEILTQAGQVAEFDEDFEFSKILNTTCSRRDTNESETTFPNDSEGLTDQIDIIVPEKALHLLLSSSTITNTWEMPVRIYAFGNNRGQLISFDDPLPLRSQDNYIYTQMFDKLVNDEIQSTRDTKWFSLAEKQFEAVSNLKAINTEIHAVDLKSKYKVYGNDEYMQQFARHAPKISNNSNSILCKWSITNENDNEQPHPINLLTRISANYVRIENGIPNFVNMSTKLENKTEFGAEVMSKSELIQEWLRQFLLADGITKRVRIDAHSSKRLLLQNLNMADIESDLMRIYFIKPSNFLGPFYSLLNVLNNFPIGDYLFKFNPKYDGKLMIYTKTQQIAPSGISVHELYENVRSKIDLLHESKYLPIDGNVIMDVHKYYAVLPSCFPYWIVDQTNFRNDKRKSAHEYRNKRQKNVGLKRPKLNNVLKRNSKNSKNGTSFKLPSNYSNTKRLPKSASNAIPQKYQTKVAKTSTKTPTNSLSKLDVVKPSKKHQLKPTCNRIYNLRSRNTI